jgi:hypothetical protein
MPARKWPVAQIKDPVAVVFKASQVELSTLAAACLYLYFIIIYL